MRSCATEDANYKGNRLSPLFLEKISNAHARIFVLPAARRRYFAVANVGRTLKVFWWHNVSLDEVFLQLAGKAFEMFVYGLI